MFRRTINAQRSLFWGNWTALWILVSSIKKLGIDPDQAVPEHSTLSQLRRRKFQGSTIVEEIITEIVKQCIEQNLVDGKLLLTDSTHVRTNARNDRAEKVLVDIEPSAYLTHLNEEARRNGIFHEKKAQPNKQKEVRKSLTDPDAGFMKRPGKPLGFHYLSHQTCDGNHGIETDVYVTAGNATDASIHSAFAARRIAAGNHYY